MKPTDRRGRSFRTRCCRQCQRGHGSKAETGGEKFAAVEVHGGGQVARFALNPREFDVRFRHVRLRIGPAGEQFLRHAPMFVQLWQRTLHQVAVPPGRRVWAASPRARRARDGRARRPKGPHGLTGRSTTTPLADPTGRYVALTPNCYLEIYDGDAGRVWASSSIPAVAFAWSPDGDWLAYAADDRNVYFLRTSDWTTRFSLPADTEGLAWR